MALTSSRMPMVVDRWLSRLKEVRKGVSNCLPDSLIQVVCHASSFKQHAVLLEGMDDPVVSSAASGASSPPQFGEMTHFGLAVQAGSNGSSHRPRVLQV